jgi:hypothetical protein
LLFLLGIANTIEGLPLEALDWSPKAGVNSIEHAYQVADSTLALMAKNGVTLVADDGVTPIPGSTLTTLTLTLYCEDADLTIVNSRDSQNVLQTNGVTVDEFGALVAAGAEIVEVRERATTLEQVYFDVMGVRPDHGEAG